MTLQKAAKHAAQHPASDYRYHKSRNGQWLFCSRMYAAEHPALGPYLTGDEIMEKANAAQ